MKTHQDEPGKIWVIAYQALFRFDFCIISGMYSNPLKPNAAHVIFAHELQKEHSNK